MPLVPIRGGSAHTEPGWFSRNRADDQFPRVRARRNNITMANSFHEANQRRWDAGAASWACRADTRGVWRKCHLDPSLALHPTELNWLSDIAGKSVAVLGSGDNQAVFALVGLGSKVFPRRTRAAQILCPGSADASSGSPSSLVSPLNPAIARRAVFPPPAAPP
jgi:hypothetical protein